MTESIQFLNLPDVEPVQYERNFIKNTVCELKFPIILDWENKPPASIQKELRRDYPYHDMIYSMPPDKEVYLNLRSKNKKWIVSIRPDAIVLETTSYMNFEDFFDRLEKVVNVVKDKIDSDFFTRVDLRYINVIDYTPDEIEGLVNQDLIAPILKNVYGTVREYLQRVNGYTEYGRFNFRHGIKPNDTPNQDYFLDFDYFKEGVEIQDALDLIKKFHEYNFKFFHWALGEKALLKLGKVIPKTEK